MGIHISPDTMVVYPYENTSAMVWRTPDMHKFIFTSSEQTRSLTEKRNRSAGDLGILAMRSSIVF